MKIALGCDHGGLEIKNAIIEDLKNKGVECIDFGTTTTDSVDYPVYAKKVTDSIPVGFYGEPEEVELPNTASELADICWKNLNEDNKVSLFVRYIDIETGKYETRIVNKNQ